MADRIAASGRSKLSDPARISRPDLCFATSSRRNSASSRLHVVERIDQRVAAANAEEQPHFAEARLEVDDDRALAGQARQLDGAVDGHGRRAGAAFGTEEHQRRRRTGRDPRPSRRAARPADRLVEGLLRRRPREELVGAGAHRLEDEVRVRAPSPRRRWPTVARGRAQRLDAGHRCGTILTRVDDEEIGLAATADRSVGHRHRHGAAAQQRCPPVVVEGVVRAENHSNESCHATSPTGLRGDTRRQVPSGGWCR